MTRLAAAWRAAAVAGGLALAAGCGGSGTPERDAATVRSEVMTQSAAVMNAAHVTGQQVGAFPPRSTPTDLSCDDGDDDSPDRVLSQMWSVHSKDNTALGKGMANLAARLPGQGWKIVRNGPDSSMSKNQEILATHLATKIQMDVTWEKNLKYGDPLIQFAVSSPCFRTK
ncbi:hypothetical protein [Actinacidiphila bryophytorum]|uniref:Lipoprotein n=1 Tax=Actinacidiphila bryophytorum TaxID=1436133 RepID=A0A9W4H1C4_9ACTN|nr:hypothetical protein [Actinacidiphila bryophytorum]MBM9434992.1 hypothetical protein [Actinacidiphila bryophytorum]MBN6544531.1 hypothetical protein [Actinacidiphila bryophytorum]CAG7642183.1 conserved exported hypothetical protein [Actinacidiphila bryophytorum]